MGSDADKKGRLSSRPFDLPAVLSQSFWRIRSTLDDVDDLVGMRAKNDVLAVNEDKLVSTPFRIDFHDPRRQRVIVDAGRHGSADRDIEVHVGDFLDLLLLDRRGDLGALFGGRRCSRRGCGIAGGLAVCARRLALGCRPECGWNSVWRILRSHEGIVSGGKVNRLIDGFCGERFPTLTLSHVYLSA